MKDSYAAVSQFGLTPAVRETAETATSLLNDQGPDARLTFKQISDSLDLAPSSGKWRIDRAIAQGYLVNDETRRGQPARIHLGDPLPEAVEALPSPATLGTPCTADPLESSNPHLVARRESDTNRSRTVAGAEPMSPDSNAADGLESPAKPAFPSGMGTSADEPIRGFESDPGKMRGGRENGANEESVPTNCPDCGTTLDRRQACWTCDYALCRDCGARSTSALVGYCPPCRVAAPRPSR